MKREHPRGELIDIRWPNGPYNFRIRFDYADEVTAPGWEDWVVLHGFVVEPKGPRHQTSRSFYAKPVVDAKGNPDGYEMLPMQVG